MEMTKAQLENERKIQQLQMQAINALWKKVSSMQHSTPTNTSATIDCQNIESTSLTTSSQNTLSLDNSSTTVVHDLAKTCTMLTNQVQQLQGSMRDILNCLSLFCNLPEENVKRLLTAGVAEALSPTSKNTVQATSYATNNTNTIYKKDSAATQTEIIAVHTPQLESQSNFPFIKIRPSTLPLIESQHPNIPCNSNNSSLITNACGIASTEDMRCSNDSMSIVEKQDEDEKHILNLTTTISG